ncbi:nitrous oxide reductase accessory protein NosL [Halomicroarcula sp. GCM10025894]|uniref:nitrous oxide reductase accessory protein NosL n=1 Tax=Halomicroarcula sp. GCM10025894 TaxID=3252673 RepID=UPI00361D8CB8
MLAGTATLLALAGCQGDSDTAEPVSIADDENCIQCGMVISDHPGPVGETFYQDATPSGRETPVTFCSTTCTYRHRFAKEQEGWTPSATFLTDYSSVDYDVRTDGGATVLTHHLDATAFAETSELTVVANSDVQGAMGTAIVPFSDSGDAEAFAEEYGGETLPAEDIRRELVSSG